LTAAADDVFGIDDMGSRMVDKTGDVMSEDARTLLETVLTDLAASQGAGAIIFGLIGSLWAGSAAVGAVMKGLNRIHGQQETRGLLERKLVAIGLAAVFSLLLLAAALSLAASEPASESISNALGWEDPLDPLVEAALFAAAIVFLALAAAFLYWQAPAQTHEFHWITPGAAVFIAGWIIASLTFSLYISTYGSYNSTYGTLGAIIIVLVWLYWSNLLLFAGAQLNALVLKARDGALDGRPRKKRRAPAQP
jgi:membrane protein